MKPSDIINFRQVSIMLANNTESIRSNKIPKKYAEPIKELIDFIEDWICRNSKDNAEQSD